MYNYPLPGEEYSNRNAIEKIDSFSAGGAGADPVFSGSSLPLCTQLDFHMPGKNLCVYNGSSHNDTIHFLAVFGATIHGDPIPNTEISIVNIRGFRAVDREVLYTTYSAYHQNQPINHNIIPGTSLASQATNVYNSRTNLGAMRIGAIRHYDPFFTAIVIPAYQAHSMWGPRGSASHYGFMMEADVSIRGKVFHAPLHWGNV